MNIQEKRIQAQNWELRLRICNEREKRGKRKMTCLGIQVGVLVVSQRLWLLVATIFNIQVFLDEVENSRQSIATMDMFVSSQLLYIIIIKSYVYCVRFGVSYNSQFLHTHCTINIACFFSFFFFSIIQIRC